MIRTAEDEERTRKRMLQAEAAALLLLLGRRRRVIQETLNPSQADEVARVLQAYAQGDILAIRQAARFAGANDMRLFWSDVPGIGIAEQLEDLRRARIYSENLAALIRSEAGAPGAIGAIDNRLATIAITENSEAFNAQRHVIANHIAERVGLVEVWDATNDKRTCDECWRMDGERAIVGIGFSGGRRPGSVHARCRCTSHVERIH